MNMIDILYVNYNSSKLLCKSIESVLENSAIRSPNVFVWDNRSNDNVDLIKRHFPLATLIKSGENVGFARGINELIQRSHSPYLVILNPDTLIEKGFVDDTIRFLENNPEVGILGPQILNADGTVQGSARKFPNPMTSLFGRSSPLTKLFPNNSITAKNILTIKNGFHQPIEVDWVSGACMVVRRQIMADLGGFDELFFLYWEDADLCRRIKSAGWKVVYFPTASVTHFGGRSSNTRPVFANYQFHKSCHLLYEKYADWPYSALTPAAAVALMLRFTAAALLNYGHILYLRVRAAASRRADTGVPNPKIKILRIISRMNIGGPSIHVKNLTEGLDKSKYDTKLITGSVSPNEGDMSYIARFGQDVRLTIPELQREIDPFKDFLALFKVIKIVNRFKPDIVDSHTSKAGAIARLAVFCFNQISQSRIIILHTFHGHVLDGYFSALKANFFQFFERLLAKMTDRIIAISESQKWELSAVYKIDSPKNIDTIKLGFDLVPFLNCSGQKGVLRKKMGVSEKTILIGIVGRLAPIKNHQMFLDAGKLLIERLKEKEIRLILVGDGEEHAFLVRYARDIDIDPFVVFHGWERDIPMIYADFDILALTSLNEGTPVSVIEALAASVPVITTGVGGIKDLLGNYDAKQPESAAFKVCERGILCPKDDARIFANALTYMIESDYLSDHHRFARAKDYVVKNYSIDRLIHDVDLYYQKLVRSRRASR